VGAGRTVCAYGIPSGSGPAVALGCV